MAQKLTYSFIQYRDSMNLPDGIYNGLYNKEPAIIRMFAGLPEFVSFIGYIKNGESKSDNIFDPKGILHSSIEILLPAQTLTIIQP